MHEFEVIEINPSTTVLHDKDRDLLIAQNECGALIYIDLMQSISFEVSKSFIVIKKDKIALSKSSIVNIVKEAK